MLLGPFGRHIIRYKTIPHLRQYLFGSNRPRSRDRLQVKWQECGACNLPGKFKIDSTSPPPPPPPTPPPTPPTPPPPPLPPPPNYNCHWGGAWGVLGGWGRLVSYWVAYWVCPQSSNRGEGGGEGNPIKRVDLERSGARKESQ